MEQAQSPTYVEMNRADKKKARQEGTIFSKNPGEGVALN